MTQKYGIMILQILSLLWYQPASDKYDKKKHRMVICRIKTEMFYLLDRLRQ